MHATWDCTAVKTLERNITDILSQLQKCCISLCLLGDSSMITLNSSSNKILCIAFIVAKKTILTNWKTKSSMTITLEKTYKLILYEWKNVSYSYIFSLYSCYQPLIFIFINCWSLPTYLRGGIRTSINTDCKKSYCYCHTTRVFFFIFEFVAGIRIMFSVEVRHWILVSNSRDKINPESPSFLKWMK